MNDTRSEIIRLGSELIRSNGYNAFSYADISKTLGIKNAAIHYYFPSKSDLGVEIIRQNLTTFNQRIASWKQLDYRVQFTNYIHMHDSFIQNNWVCIVGSLAPSYDTLPENMQKELQVLINTILRWLTDLLDSGLKSNVFSFCETSRTKAFIIHSALLSSLQMNKVLRNDVYKSIQDGLLNI